MDTEKLLAELELLSVDIDALSGILNVEFEAIKAQDMAQLEQIQVDKENALLRLSDGRFQEIMSALEQQQAQPDSTQLQDKWQDLIGAAEASRSHLVRNQMLIQRKLMVLREALQSLYQTDSSQGLQLYNRLGKLAGHPSVR
jgi:flagellar biosynthesis/type III secretory pathway chaperone